METSALVITEPGKPTQGEALLPELGPREVLGRVEFSVASVGTERWVCTGRFPTPQEAPGFPLVPGYQNVGVIERIGKEVEGYQPGKRVFLGIGRLERPISMWGAHAAWGVGNTQGWCLPLPEEVDPLEAAALAVAQVGYNAAEYPDIRPGELVVVIGGGIIGQMTAQCARLRGARVILIDRHPEKVELAQRWSADVALGEGEIEKVLKEEGRLADVVVESVGREENIDQALSLVRARGRIVLLGWYPQRISIDLPAAHIKEVCFYNPSGATRPRLQTTLQLLCQRKLHLRPLINHICPASEAPEAYRRMLAKEHDFLSMAIDWRGAQ